LYTNIWKKYQKAGEFSKRDILTRIPVWIDNSFQTEEERMKKKHICDVIDEKQERKEIRVYLYTDKLQEINLMTNMKM